MTIAIKLSDAQERRLSEIAARLNVAPETLAQAAIRELVEESSGDFDTVTARLLEKNRDLYERLS